MIYTDGVHLTAQSLSELCAYGTQVGLDSYWLQAGKKLLHPHFLICGKVKERVLADRQVVKVSTRQLIDIFKASFTPPEIPSQDDNSATLPTESDYERMIDNIFNKAGLHRKK